jgi:hypothetical protein
MDEDELGEASTIDAISLFLLVCLLLRCVRDTTGRLAPSICGSTFGGVAAAGASCQPPECVRGDADTMAFGALHGSP